jgi:U4/U6 small nuclear ribonucleoprotein PRP3
VVKHPNQYHKANTRNIPTPPPMPSTTPVSVDAANPYASGSAAAANDKGLEGAPRERTGRSFRFNQKGKYVQIGNQMRQQQQLEQLKQKIAESARKAGLDAEFETLEKNIKVVSDYQFITPRSPVPCIV